MEKAHEEQSVWACRLGNHTRAADERFPQRILAELAWGHSQLVMGAREAMPRHRTPASLQLTQRMPPGKWWPNGKVTAH